ncbi:hypothetical protein ACJMK2_021901 [Sinanodonta woodiana]|uniref:NIDO domain-containing protein n=1 Tax=Sinanodonta woodiana TaxID=1069815 RepID=A0ABD3THE8_SINWO
MFVILDDGDFVPPFYVPTDIPFKKSDGTIPKIISPLWTRVANSSLTKIWYHLYYKNSPTNSSFPSSINRIFKASNNRVNQLLEILQAVVITWENMVPYGETNTSEVATIQLVIITTSIETYVNIYAKDVTWSDKRVPEGAMFFQCDKNMYYREAGSNTPKMFNRIKTKKNSDSRVSGTWTFKTDACSESVLSSLPNDKDKCNVWLKKERQLSPLSYIPCPCSLFQVIWDPRFTWYNSPHSSSICYMYVAWWTTQGRVSTLYQLCWWSRRE